MNTKYLKLLLTPCKKTLIRRVSKEYSLPLSGAKGRATIKKAEARMSLKQRGGQGSKNQTIKRQGIKDQRGNK